MPNTVLSILLALSYLCLILSISACEVGMIILLILQIGKLRHSEVVTCPESHSCKGINPKEPNSRVHDSL